MKRMLLFLLIATLEVQGRAGGWVPGPQLPPRYGHTVTVLPNGMALIAGGVERDSAEHPFPYATGATLFDPGADPSVSEPMKWIQSMLPRGWHTATLLLDGTVLVAGGRGSNGVVSVCDLFSPSEEVWSEAAPMGSARASHTATLLPDGKVLVTGGADDLEILAGAELYDPRMRSWASAASMIAPRKEHFAISLAGGNVLVVGGITATVGAEIYDPAADRWAAAPGMSTDFVHGATILPDGKVFVFGLSTSLGRNIAEIYDPASGLWTRAADPVGDGRATLLKNGKVILEGAGTGRPCVGTMCPPKGPGAGIYDPASDSWRKLSEPWESRPWETATLLPDGRLLTVGVGPNNTYFYGESGITSWLFTYQEPSPIILSRGEISGKAVRFTFAHGSGESFEAFASDTLDPQARWSLMGQVQEVSTGLYQFEEAIPPAGARFYRVQLR
jgi:hypothetical protein